MIVCLGTTPAVQRTMTFTKLTLGSVNRTPLVHEFASGKSINVARVLHTLHEPCIATGFIGGDRGGFIRQDLDRAGIRHDFINVGPGTRLCITVLDESKRIATELVEEAKPLSRDDGNALLEKLAALLSGAKVLVLSGSLAPGLPSSFYADCITLAGTNIPVILDASGEPLDVALDRRPAVVKINRDELSQALDAEVEDEDAVRGAMRQMIVRGARWIVVTAGTRATLISDGRRFWTIATPTVDAINPIGSGDAFAAGLAAGIARGQDVPQACLLGVACAAANAMTPHAGHVEVSRVTEMLAQVQLS